jgi:hypothetical protein
MMDQRNERSLRLIRKGALTAETYALFAKWNDALPFEGNLRQGLAGMFQTSSWENEVRTTVRRRFRNQEEAQVLVGLAQRGLPFDEWCSCLHLWIGIHEEFYRLFSTEWLFPEFLTGRYIVRVDDVIPFVSEHWPRLKPEAKRLSDYGVTRIARDMIRMAADFGILTGAGASRKFATFHLTDRCFMYWAQRIAEHEGSTSMVPTSSLWRMVLMRPCDVEQELLRLHQYRKMEYQVAGSLVQLTLACPSSSEYAEGMIE